MDLEIVTQSEVSQTRERQIYKTAYVWNQKKWYKWTYLQNRNRVTHAENKPMVTNGERVGGVHWEVGIDIYTVSYIKTN